MNVFIVNETPGIFGGGNNNSFVYFIGSQLSLTCLITSTPVTNSEFRWRCSTGCLNGVEIGQTINVTVEQGGMITCAYIVDGIEYSSDPIEIRVPVTGKLYLWLYTYMTTVHSSNFIYVLLFNVFCIYVIVVACYCCNCILYMLLLYVCIYVYVFCSYHSGKNGLALAY